MKPFPAIALIEYGSIAAGAKATDALVKRAPVTLVRSGSLQPGNYAVLFGGEVAAVEDSFVTGLQVGGEAVLDRMILPNVDEGVYDALLGRVMPWAGDTIGVIETSTLAATVQAADAGVKGANVTVLEIRLGDGLGGKGLVHLAGLQADMEAAIQIGAEAAGGDGRTICTAIIPRIDDDVRSILGKSTRFAGGD